MQLAQYTQYTVLSGGLELNIGNVKSGWLSVSVDTVAGQATGTGITVRITGFKVHQIYQVAYGAPALTIPFTGNLIKVTGTGAVIELLASTEHVVTSPVVLTPGTVAVSGTVDTDFGQSSIPNDLANNTGAVAGLVYSPGAPPALALAVGVTDPPQVAVTGGKAVPVKTET
jgi:hypothetical protein